VRADAIIVLDCGPLVDMAPHAVLLGRCEICRGLRGQQTEHMA
jgi:ABC-type multidrug transport system fused ATPase/permease subunit